MTLGNRYTYALYKDNDLAHSEWGLQNIFRLFQNHNSIQTCSNSCSVCEFFNSLVSANWWQSKIT